MFGFFVCGFALMCGGMNGTAIGGPATLGGVPTLNHMFTIGSSVNGDAGWGLFGTTGFFLSGAGYDSAVIVLFLFMMVFMDTPPTLLHNLEHNHVLHENIVFLSIVTETSSRVPERERMRIEMLAPGVWRMIGHYGFMDQPDAPDLLLHSGLINGLRDATFFLGQEHLLVSEGRRAWRWRMLLFSVLSRLAQPATRFFNIPPSRVMEVGIQIVL